MSTKIGYLLDPETEDKYYPITTKEAVVGLKGDGSGTVTNVNTGTGLSGGPIDDNGTISLKESTTGEIGGVKIAGTKRSSAITTTLGGTTSDRYYGVEIDANNKAFVNVPWVNTTYTPANASPLNVSTSAAVGTSTDYAREDHVHAISLATGDSSGLIKIAGQNVTVKDINNAAYKDVSTSVTSGDDKLITSGAVYTALDNLPKPMIFKGSLGTGGTITSLPTAATSNQGFVYKVITAGTYSSQSAKIGDAFISTGSDWILIPSGDEPSGTVTNVATGVGLTGGPITSTGTIKVKLKNESRNSSLSYKSTASDSSLLSTELDSSGNLSTNIPWNGDHPNMGVGKAKNFYGGEIVHLDEYLFIRSDINGEIAYQTACIDKIYGNTLIWNQTGMKDPIPTDCIFNEFNNIYTIYPNSGITSFQIESVGNFIPGHVVYLSAFGNYVGSGDAFLDISISNDGSNWENILKLAYDSNFSKHSEIITIPKYNSLIYRPIIVNDASDTDTATIGYVMAIDLTLMYGEGKEPMMAEEFEAKKYPLLYYDYNLGEVINNSAVGIETTGFNQWDEEWEVGILDSSGQPDSSTTRWRSKNFCDILDPDAQYYIKSPYPMVINFYDADKNYLYRTNPGVGVMNEVFTPSNNNQFSGVRYFKMWTMNAFAGSPTYQNDICINLSFNGYPDGEYEPYEKHTLYFNGLNGSLATIAGKLNGEGSSVTVFPNGMCGFDEVYDIAFSKEGMKRIYSVDLGSLSWSHETALNGTTKYFWTTDLPKNARYIDTTTKHSFRCANYCIGATDDDRYNGDMEDKSLYVGQDRVAIRDDSFLTENDFTLAMSGVLLYYILDTPEIYIFDSKLAMNFYSNELGGTMTRLPIDTQYSILPPISYDYHYDLDALKTIRMGSVEYIKKESLDNFVNELSEKLSTLLNTNISTSTTFDPGYDNYNFSISIPTSSVGKKVWQNPETSNADYPVLVKNSANLNSETNGTKYVNTTNKGVTINPSTGCITAPKFIIRESDGAQSNASKIMLSNGYLVSAPTVADTYLKYDGSSIEWDSPQEVVLIMEDNNGIEHTLYLHGHQE